MADVPTPPHGLVARWLRAVAARDIDAAMACVADDVEVIASGNQAHGRDELRAWFISSTATSQPLRWFARSEHVVVEALMTTLPRDPQFGAPHAAVRGASHYTVRDRAIIRIDHVADPEEARRRAGLTDADEIEAPAA